MIWKIYLWSLVFLLFLAFLGGVGKYRDGELEPGLDAFMAIWLLSGALMLTLKELGFWG